MRAASRKVWRVLGIESSCDDTGVAVVTSAREVLAERVVGQRAVHEVHGGIVPRLAAAAHARALPELVRATLDDCRLEMSDIDAVAVTRGPGLGPCLSVGLNGAKTLAAVSRVPLLGVHHMAAHALTARLTDASITFPYLCLLVSGGHTLLVLVQGPHAFQQLSTTLDDSIGDAFDKVSRALQLPWQAQGGAGAALEAVAQSGSADRYGLPQPMRNLTDVVGFDFSFSGLKTATLRLIDGLQASGPLEAAVRADVAASFQHATVRHLEQRIDKVLDFCAVTMPDVTLSTLVVSGGVARNNVLRSRLGTLCAARSLRLALPPPTWCTDNGVMIAWAGAEWLASGRAPSLYSVEYRPVWPLSAAADDL